MDHRIGGRKILLHGMCLVLAGMIWGLIVPQTPLPRLALSAHVQFILNGMLLIVLATALLKLPHRVGPRSVAIMLLGAWLTWPLVLSEVANAWWGTIRILPIVAAQAGVAGGLDWQELVVQACHVVPGLAYIASWALLVVGFARPGASDGI